MVQEVPILSSRNSLPDLGKMVGIMEDSDAEGLNVVDPSDRGNVEKGLAKDSQFSFFVETSNHAVFMRDCLDEVVERDGAPGRVLGRPQAAQEVREVRAGIDVVYLRLEGTAFSGSSDEGSEWPEQLMEASEEAMDDGNVRKVFAQRPLIVRGTPPKIVFKAERQFGE